MDAEARAKFYKSKEWRAMREFVLSNEPLCRYCFYNDRIVGADHVDHIIDIADRLDLRLTLSNLQPLCNSCHSTKTIQLINGESEKDMRVYNGIDLDKLIKKLKDDEDLL